MKKVVGQVAIDGDEIVIRVPIAAMVARIVRYHHNIVVTDANELAASLAADLNRNPSN